MATNFQVMKKGLLLEYPYFDVEFQNKKINGKKLQKIGICPSGDLNPGSKTRSCTYSKLPNRQHFWLGKNTWNIEIKVQGIK